MPAPPAAGSETAPDDLDRALEAIAQVPVLFVATDYDGTLAAIVDDPSQAVPVRE